MTPVFRFAPSPNGLLHLGHALSAGLNARASPRTGGRFLLRVEDIDAARATSELEQAMFRDLGWLGLEWEKPVLRQSEHRARYRQALEYLAGEGLAYPAFLSRGDLRAHAQAHPSWPRDPDGAPLYPGEDRLLTAAERERRIAAGIPFAWRLDMAAALARISQPIRWQEWQSDAFETSDPVQADPAAWGDVVIGRKEVGASYHLAVVLDDAHQSVTHIVRGCDLFHATAVHRVLQILLGLSEPTYHHHRLILGSDGRKLSKSENSAGISVWRETGATPADVWRAVGL